MPFKLSNFATTSPTFSKTLCTLPLYPTALSANSTTGSICTNRSTTAVTPVSGLTAVQTAPSAVAASIATSALV